MNNGSSSKAFLTSVLSVALGSGDPTEVFCRMLADETNLYYVGKDGDKYKFHDVFEDKEILLTEDEVMKNL